MAKILLPNTYIEKIQGPFIYLAGPIKGASNWQSQAIDFFTRDITVASPRTSLETEREHEILQGDTTKFDRQRAWERHYMGIAARTGVLLFWLPREAQHHCDKAFGANTRLELGEWMTRLSFEPTLRVVIGTDGQFPDLDVVMYDLRQHDPSGGMYSTLDVTCLSAMSRLNM